MAEQTLIQRRSQHAWQSIQGLNPKNPSKEANACARQAKKLPMRIRTAGLGQALAFLLAKSDMKQQDYLHKKLTDWVLKQRGGIRGEKPNSLIESIVFGDADFLRQATAESLAWLEWFNRFAEAEGLKQDESV